MGNVYTVPLHRRLNERFKIEASGTLIVDPELRRPSIVENLSPRGAGLVCSHQPSLNAEVGLIIKAPFLFADAVYRRAKVVWFNRIGENLWQAGLDFGLDNQLNL